MTRGLKADPIQDERWLDLLSSLRLENGRPWGEVARDFQLQDARSILVPDPAVSFQFLTRARGFDESHDLPYNSDGIYFLLDPAIASGDCEEREQAGVGRSAHDLAAAIEGTPGLTTSEAKPVTVGGLDGVQLDLRLDPRWKKTCVFSEELPVVPLLFRKADIGAYHWTILPDMSMRWYILDSGEGSIIVDIEDGPSGLPRDDLLKAGGEIVDSLVFSASS